MNGLDLARIELLAYFLHRLGVKIHPDFVIKFRRRRRLESRRDKNVWADWNKEIESKLLTEKQINWKWEITPEE